MLTQGGAHPRQRGLAASCSSCGCVGWHWHWRGSFNLPQVAQGWFHAVRWKLQLLRVSLLPPIRGKQMRGIHGSAGTERLPGPPTTEALPALPPAAAAAAAGRALLLFRNASTGWHLLAEAAGPKGLPGWEASSPLDHCSWGGVACCTGDLVMAEGTGDQERVAVCSIRLDARGIAGGKAAGSGDGDGDGGGRGVVTARLDPLWELTWLTAL